MSIKEKSRLSRYIEADEGATAIEYGLLSSLIGVAIITAVQTLATEQNTTFNEIAKAMSTASVDYLADPNLSFSSLTAGEQPALFNIFDGLNGVSKNSFQGAVDRLDKSSIPIGASLSFDTIDNQGNIQTYTLQKTDNRNRYSIYNGTDMSGGRVGNFSSLSSQDYNFGGEDINAGLGPTHGQDA